MTNSAEPLAWALMILSPILALWSFATVDGTPEASGPKKPSSRAVTVLAAVVHVAWIAGTGFFLMSGAPSHAMNCLFFIWMMVSAQPAGYLIAIMSPRKARSGMIRRCLIYIGITALFLLGGFAGCCATFDIGIH